jgi:hypothetical protein
VIRPLAWLAKALDAGFTWEPARAELECERCGAVEFTGELYWGLCSTCADAYTGPEELTPAFGDAASEELAE